MGAKSLGWKNDYSLKVLLHGAIPVTMHGKKA